MSSDLCVVYDGGCGGAGAAVVAGGGVGLCVDGAIGTGPAPPGAHSVEDDAYQPTFVEMPTYAEAFPPLPGGPGGPGPGLLANSGVGSAGPAAGPLPPIATFGKWSSKMSMRSSSITQVFCVPLEERRFKEMTEQQFGEKGGQQAKICSQIMAETNVSIEMSLAKDQSLTVVITGKLDCVMKARKLVVQQLQTQARFALAIPKKHHRFILGPKGKKLAELELVTATKITIPRVDENSDSITIIGTKEGIENARHEIQLVSDEQAKLAFERLSIPKIYHPFILGPNGSVMEALSKATGARISASGMKDEVVVSGEKEGVHMAVDTINKIYQEKQAKCQTVSVEVGKSQHKYVLGTRRANLATILAETGVSAEIPPLDSTSETITLRGEQDKLGAALTLVYSFANSVINTEVNAPAWLHRFIIGKGGATVREITNELPKVHIEFTEGENKITLEGPPEQVEEAKIKLEAMTNDLLARMAFAEIDVAQKYHGHVIGKNGANVSRLKKETGVAIRIPPDHEKCNIIRIEGTPEGVAHTKKELLEMVMKMENEKSSDIIIEQRFHRTIIGQQGAKIREIRDMFNQVQVMFPDSHRKSDVVTLRGPKRDVDNCYKYLQTMLKDLVINNYVAEVHIFKQFHKNIIGKGGANIRKIREETKTRIELPSENSESDVITVTGQRENVELAKSRIEAIQKELVNIKEITVDVPHKHHNSLIGAKGRLIRSVMEECGGVMIHFPPEGANSDHVVIRGPPDDVENARRHLLELANEKYEESQMTEIHARPEFHKFLIGRGGANIRKVRDATKARIVFPTPTDTDQELITIIGREEAVQAAKAELLALISNLENIIEDEICVDPKHHRHFVARNGQLLRQIAEDFGGVTVSFPRAGVRSDKVVLKGSRDCVDGAKQRILDIVADRDQQVTIECVIPQKYHRTVMGAKGYQVQQITREFNVNIKFPDRPIADNDSTSAAATAPADSERWGVERSATTPPPMTNGDSSSGPENNDGITASPPSPSENGSGDAAVEPRIGDSTPPPPRKQDIILISGKPENCEAASQALQDKVPITEDVAVPYDLHRFVIGQKGRDVRRLMERHDVNVSVPPADRCSDVVTVTGAPAAVRAAKEELMERVAELMERAAKTHQLELELDEAYHPKIIGRRGAVITKIRQQHDVQIQFAERGSERPDVITITGLEENTKAARDDIMKIVDELNDMITLEVHIDQRIHSRLIGARGRAIRRIMEDFKVSISFPNRQSDQPDVVSIMGLEDDVLDCKEHLQNIEEEYMQDLHDVDVVKQYTKAPSRHDDSRGGGSHRDDDPQGYVVRNAPWSGAPDTSSTTDFPAFGDTSPGTAAPQPVPAAAVPRAYSMSWGPSRKR